MAATVTPERIKTVLSSFLVRTEKSPSVLETFSKPSISQESENLSADDAASPKSSSVALRSHKSFLKRLDTFSARTWFGKPSELSPLVCARFGWENVDTDMLQCAGCKTFLSGKLPAMSDTEAYNRGLDKLKTNVVSSHDRLCVFGKFPCPEDFCHVQVDDVAILSASFIKRLSALSAIQDQLPCLNLTLLEHLGYDEGQAGAYCKRHLMPDRDISPQAVTLAVMGWSCSPSSKDVLVCSMCRRKIGLWNFISSSGGSPQEKSSDSSEDPNAAEDDGEPRAKRKRMPATHKKDALNPMDEHNHWCPWIQKLQSTKSSSSVGSSPISSVVLSPSSTSSIPQSPCSTPKKGAGKWSSSDPASSVPVFIAALKSIAPGLMDNNTGLATGMKKSPMNEGLRRFRRAMDTWSSPKGKSPNSSQNSEEPSPVVVSASKST